MTNPNEHILNSRAIKDHTKLAVPVYDYFSGYYDLACGCKPVSRRSRRLMAKPEDSVIRCNACNKWFHTGCVESARNFEMLPGDFFYVYLCGSCFKTSRHRFQCMVSQFQKLFRSWAERLRLAIYNMQFEKGQQYKNKDKRLFHTRAITQYLDKHWEAITSSRSREYAWFTEIQRTLRNNPQIFVRSECDNEFWTLLPIEQQKPAELPGQWRLCQPRCSRKRSNSCTQQYSNSRKKSKVSKVKEEEYYSRKSSSFGDCMTPMQLVFSKDSLLAKVDLKEVINLETWNMLDESMRHDLEGLITKQDRVNIKAMFEDAQFETALRDFQAMLANGDFDPALEEQRNYIRGKYRRQHKDSWKETEYEDHWGEKLVSDLIKEMEDLEQNDSSADVSKNSKKRNRENKRKRGSQEDADEEWKGKVGSIKPNHRRYSGYGTRSSTRNTSISSVKIKTEKPPSRIPGETTKECPKCKRRFRMWVIEDRRKWKWHITVNHSYPCPVPSCGLLFHHYKSLATHKRTHTKKELDLPISMYHIRENDDDPSQILRTRLVKPQPLPPDTFPLQIMEDPKDACTGKERLSKDSLCRGRNTKEPLSHSYSPLLSNAYFRVDKSVPSTPSRVIPPAVVEKIKVRNQLRSCLRSNQFLPLVRRGLIPNGFHPHSNRVYQPAKFPDNLHITPVDHQVGKGTLPTYSLMNNVFPRQGFESDLQFSNHRERFISQASDINIPLHPSMLSRGVPEKFQQFCTHRQYPSSYLRKSVELPGRPYRRPQSSKQHILSPLTHKHSSSGISYMFPAVSDMKAEESSSQLPLHQDLYKAQDEDTALALLRLTSKKRFLNRATSAGLGRNSVETSSLPDDTVS